MVEDVGALGSGLLAVKVYMDGQQVWRVEQKTGLAFGIGIFDNNLCAGDGVADSALAFFSLCEALGRFD